MPIPPMQKLLSSLTGPCFDFLVSPVGQCWERRGRLKKECFHHPASLRLQDAVVAVFAEAFFESHPLFDWWRATEYTGDELRLLGQLLCRQIEAVSSCHTPKQFQAKLPELLVCYCNDDLGDWHPQWRRVRNELETYGRQILKRIAQAEREHKALLVMGV